LFFRAEGFEPEAHSKLQAKVCLTKKSEGGNMKKRIWVDVVEAEATVGEDLVEEF
jgi:hypothetical protein